MQVAGNGGGSISKTRCATSFRFMTRSWCWTSRLARETHQGGLCCSRTGFISLNDVGVEVCANRLSYLVAKGGESLRCRSMLRRIELEKSRNPVMVQSRAPKGSATQVSLLQGEPGQTTAFQASRLDDSTRVLKSLSPISQFSRAPTDSIFTAVLYVSDSDTVYRYTDEGASPSGSARLHSPLPP